MLSEVNLAIEYKLNKSEAWILIVFLLRIIYRIRINKKLGFNLIKGLFGLVRDIWYIYGWCRKISITETYLCSATLVASW